MLAPSSHRGGKPNDTDILHKKLALGGVTGWFCIMINTETCWDRGNRMYLTTSQCPSGLFFSVASIFASVYLLSVIYTLFIIERQNFSPSIALLNRRFLPIMGEVFVATVQPVPFLAHVNGFGHNISIVSIFLRGLWVLRVLRNRSAVYKNRHCLTPTEAKELQLNDLFILKVYLFHYPIKFILVMLFIITMGSAYAALLTERNSQSTVFDTFDKCLWLAFASVLTFSFSDMQLLDTTWARLCMLVCRAFGMIMWALVIGMLTFYVIPNQFQKHVLFWLKSINRVNEKRTRAAVKIQRWWRAHVELSNVAKTSSTKSSKTPRMHRHVLRAIRFRNEADTNRKLDIIMTILEGQGCKLNTLLARRQTPNRRRKGKASSPKREQQQQQQQSPQLSAMMKEWSSIDTKVPNRRPRTTSPRPPTRRMRSRTRRALARRSQSTGAKTVTWSRSDRSTSRSRSRSRPRRSSQGLRVDSLLKSSKSFDFSNS